MADLARATAGELVELYRKGALSPVEVARDVLKRAEASAGTINAFCCLDESGALASARAAEQRYRDKEPRSALDGVPVSIKDNVAAEGMPTMFGSRAVDRGAACHPDSPSVARLREAGLVIFGKTCLPDFAHKIFCDSPLTGVTRNPWNTAHTPGGSSGGSSAAVAAGIGPLSIGTDGGASIRLPAAFTGTVGFKPSFGRVPHHPRGAYAPLSHVGPIARSVADAAMAMDIIVRPDSRDWYALPPDAPGFVKELAKGIAGVKVAYSETLGLADLVIAPDALERLRAAAKVLEGLGARIDKADPPAIQRSVANHGAMWTSFSMLLEQSLGARAADLDKTLRGYAEIGRSLPRDAYLNAVIGRGEVGHEINAFFDRYEFLVCPVFPGVAPSIDQTLNDELPMPSLTCWVNQCGLPAVSVYCGLGSNGLPVGLHIIGGQYRDSRVLAAAAAFETAFGRATYPI